MASLTFDYINTTVANVVTTAESSLQTKVSKLDPPNTSPTDLLLLQSDVSKWTMMLDLQSTLVKTISDAMKGIIQKSG